MYNFKLASVVYFYWERLCTFAFTHLWNDHLPPLAPVMQTVLILSKAGDFHCRLFVTSVDSVLISKILSMFIYLKFILWLQFYLSSGSPAWWAGHGSSILCNTINFLCLIWVSSSIYRLVLQLGGQNKEPQYLGVSIICMLFNYTTLSFKILWLNICTN